MKDALYVVIAVGVVAFFIVRQRRSDRFRERSLLFPLALGVYGAVLLTQTTEHDSLDDRIRRAAAHERARFSLLRRDSRPDDRAFMRGEELWERASWTTIGVGWGGSW